MQGRSSTNEQRSRSTYGERVPHYNLSAVVVTLDAETTLYHTTNVSVGVYFLYLAAPARREVRSYIYTNSCIFKLREALLYEMLP